MLEEVDVVVEVESELVEADVDAVIVEVEVEEDEAELVVEDNEERYSEVVEVPLFVVEVVAPVVVAVEVDGLEAVADVIEDVRAQESVALGVVERLASTKKPEAAEARSSTITTIEVALAT